MPIAYEYQGVRRDGSLIWLLNMVRVVTWDGQPAIRSTVIDVTTRKQAADTLSKWETLFRSGGRSTATITLREHRNQPLAETCALPVAQPQDEEARRLAALQQTALLDSLPEHAFDRLTEIACRLLPLHQGTSFRGVGLPPGGRRGQGRGRAHQGTLFARGASLSLPGVGEEAGRAWP